MGLFGGTRVSTNMAEVSVDCSNTTEVIDRSKSESVNLRDKGVPGAIFLPREIPEECTLKQLQRWLLSLGAKAKNCMHYKCMGLYGNLPIFQTDQLYTLKVFSFQQ